MVADWEERFSHLVMVPVQDEAPFEASIRRITAWRGIPLEVPYRLDAVFPNQKISVVKRWREAETYFLKLVHPIKGTTVDYAIRGLFHPEKQGRVTEQIFAFLELAPDFPGGGDVQTSTVVEVLDSSAVLTLTPDEVQLQWSYVEAIAENRLIATPKEIEALFGEMLPWENPDYGERGNLRCVCVGCLKPVRDIGQMTRDCETAKHAVDEAFARFTTAPPPSSDASDHRIVKLVVAGPYGSGTTTFLRTLSRYPGYRHFSLSNLPGTEGCSLSLSPALSVLMMSVPGQRRWDFVWEVAAELATGLVLLVDATKPEMFHEAKSTLDKMHSYFEPPIATLIAVNNYDRPEAFSIDDLRQIFPERTNVKIVPCNAGDFVSANEALIDLITLIQLFRTF